MERRFAVRVDIDTVRGLVDGVPPMLDLCDHLGIKASFFVSVGRDTAARALLHAPRVSRHVAISPIRKYGLREILGSLVGLDFSPHADRFKAIEKRGHEVQLHCYDHLEWIKRVDRANVEEITSMLGRGFRAFERIMGRPPKAFASPAFKVTEAVLDVEEQMGFAYASDYARDGDCVPFRTDNRGVLQIPVNAPLIEDLVAKGLGDDEVVSRMLKVVQDNSLTVIYVHACYESRLKHGVLSSVLGRSLEAADNVTLMEVCRDWSPSG